jgi:DNA-binding beta-propeller fold protein YncE
MNRAIIGCVAALAAFSFAVAAGPARADATDLTPGTPIPLPGAAGKFDHMTFDSAQNRVYASHPGNKSLAMLDIASGQAKEIALGVEVNGVAVDRKHGRFLTAGGGGKLFILDGSALTTQKEIDLPGPGDGIFYDSADDRVYVDNDGGTNIWVYDPTAGNVVQTLTIDKAPESSVFDRKAHILYQNIKTANEIQEIDTQSGKVLANWPTAPATSPHGLVMDAKSQLLFCAGKNDTLVAIDVKTGAVTQTVTLASATDQIAVDSKLRRIYCPGSGSITVVQLDDAGKATVAQTLTVPKTAHTICIDPKTHTVWICYFDTDHSYFQPYTAS